MVVKPFGSRVFVELLPVGSRTLKSGLVLPDRVSEPSRFGVILECGPEVKRVKKGDKVLIQYYTGTGIDYPGCGLHYDTHRVMEESEILGGYEE